MPMGGGVTVRRVKRNPQSARRGPARRVRIAAIVVAGLGVAAAPGWAAPSGGGWDVSFPQCAGTGTVSLPAAPAIGVVGVNDGRPFTTNPCLTAQAAWAGSALHAYMNTDDPGPRSRQWPAVTTAKTHTGPKRCVAIRRSRATTACAYDYGWKAARDAYARLSLALHRLAAQPANAGRIPASAAGVRWWLDAESANAWSGSVAMNTASIAGSLAYLRAAKAVSVGVYANRYDSHTLFAAGSRTFPAGTLSWLATGATTLTGGLEYCGYPGFTGSGYTWMVQFWPSSLDADAQCAGFVTGLRPLTAGVAGEGVRVNLVQPATATTSITLASSSPGGRFALTAAGPWTTTLTIPIAAGSRQSRAVAYDDTRSGVPTLTASVAGVPGRIAQRGSVTAGPPTQIAISPAGPTLAVGQTRVLALTGTDAYGNRVMRGLGGRWTSAPGVVGSVGSGTARTTVFHANAVGTSSVTATVGALAAHASVAVVAPAGGAPGTIVGGLHLTAGRPSAALRVRSWAPATGADGVWTVRVGSTTGRIASSPSGPWRSVLSVTVAPGGVLGTPFYVRDTRTGSSEITASGPLGTISRAESVGAGATVRVAVTPVRSHLALGAVEVLHLAGWDAFGNSTVPRASWVASRPRVVHLARARGPAVRVIARTGGRSWVTAHVGILSSSALVFVP